MEDTKPATVIAVAPGTRTLGVAVFKGLDLVYYGIKEASKHRLKHTPASRAREAVRTIEQGIHKYQPDHFVTLSPHPFQRLSDKLSVIIEEIACTARNLQLRFYEYQRTELRNQLCSGTRATRQIVSAHLSVLYPELARHMQHVSVWQQRYYARMFDAIAAGYVRTLELQRERERLQLARLDQRTCIINTNDYETATRSQAPCYYPRPLP